jgi:NAD(P) transhydrogenase subunit beta
VPHHLGWILAALALGSALGAWGARTVHMTDMPQMVALLNGLGGGAAALVSAVEFLAGTSGVSVLLGTLIGAISFSGSLVAFGKLQGLLSEKALVLPGGRALHGLTLLACLGAGAWVLLGGGAAAYGLFAGLALLFGVVIVLPVGGADMPVVISILNSMTGSPRAAGFVLGNASRCSSRVRSSAPRARWRN